MEECVRAPPCGWHHCRFCLLGSFATSLEVHCNTLRWQRCRTAVLGPVVAPLSADLLECVILYSTATIKNNQFFRFSFLMFSEGEWRWWWWWWLPDSKKAVGSKPKPVQFTCSPYGFHSQSKNTQVRLNSELQSVCRCECGYECLRVFQCGPAINCLTCPACDRPGPMLLPAGIQAQAAPATWVQEMPSGKWRDGCSLSRFVVLKSAILLNKQMWVCLIPQHSCKCTWTWMSPCSLSS